MTASLNNGVNTPLTPGDPAPNFIQRSANNPRYVFNSAAGRYLVLCFFGSAADAHGQAALEAAYGRPDIFDDDRASFFGVSADPEDETSGRVTDRLPGYRHFWDFDVTASRLYGVVAADLDPSAGTVPLARQWVVIDPTMRVITVVPFRQDRSDLAEVMAVLDDLPPPGRYAGVEIMAPILFLPRVFEPELCRHLIGLYEAQGGQESGFMREIEGRTRLVTDPGFKRRKDYIIEDQNLISALQARFIRRVVPEIAKVHQFKVTRMERNIVSCYDADDGGHFSAHRDNTTKGTAHRRFAVSVNLNEEFEGGEVCFPEYGPRSFKAPPGGAVVFSCSLLHRVSRVTQGRRYAFLPFLYDEDAARLREENARHVDGGSDYRAGQQKASAQST
ncbi:MAG: 2OG-Fe(II) oxygenase [Hoeflea sp.]|uniref:2OG-Fe(II) oxygenase n=1 Tax=Hoeflea sp. TaxID=1940281 RepID=UPI001D57F6EC|nr:2OG-Fe(II) oxygenase [Hoeflea sp.]MBU4530409.1 2OG-Fe(II) oxygenase [Alphaproteobacteria bacterium]MBU4545196.1 2OG-Fe(II) oxygenase [Alphaproteobacteria bacterium]MBU4549604.1 2OG-Fe(II) oxygenase [Alphaproteobacteria bacterium]MBV1721999.1 2OG-Fe(II) oxygenase [Hoeflea sp.]MBV1761349.1 2OG-Fe(II) oxygenase [Hoeflea sp.]